MKRLFLGILLTINTCVSGEIVRRGRDEGTMNIPASNVLGTGNITAQVSALGIYSYEGAGIEPQLGFSLGIADILQLSASMSFPNASSIGSSKVRLHLTTPGNDRLRFMGLALSGDLHLSTVADTFNLQTGSQRPDYNHYILPTLFLDQDWIALFSTLPVKTYQTISLVDEPDLLHRYQQISIKAGMELKWYSNSVFVDAGLGLYKENRHRTYAGDRTYEQKMVWIEPGGRYRVKGRHSLLGSLRVPLFLDVKPERPISSALLRLAVAWETPLYYKETNTEAIRTLVFMENTKEKTGQKDFVGKTIDQKKRLRTEFSIDLDSGLQPDVHDEDQEQMSIKKREEIQAKMDEIEQLFESLD